MDYEKFRNEIILNLDSMDVDAERIVSMIDIISNNYEIKQKSTEIVLYDYDQMPEVLKMYLVSKKMEGMADGTLYNYGKHLKMFFQRLQKLPNEVTTNDIRIYLMEYQRERNIKNTSLDKLRMYISSFYKWAVSENYIDKDPTVNIKHIKCENRKVSPLTQIDLEYLRKGCETKREIAILETLYSTGCRVTELATLKKNDIDFNTKKVQLFGKGKKHRTSFLNAKAEVAIKDYLNTRNDNCEYLFISERGEPKPIKKEAYERIMKNIYNRVKDDIGVKVTPHVIRHTTATTALQNGMNIEEISKLLGHSNINTTMIYADVNDNELEYKHKKSII